MRLNNSNDVICTCYLTLNAIPSPSLTSEARGLVMQ